MRPVLEKKISDAIRLIQMAAPQDGKPIEVCYSGGKDSDIILNLTQHAGVNYEAIYKNTTIDPPFTHKHCEENNVSIMQPQHSFLYLIEHNGMPTRRVRHCCRTLKEYKVLDTAVQGIRRCESTARELRYSPDDPIICRTYGAKSRTASIVLPILNWTDEDVSEYIDEMSIKCHPLYYDEDGNFHVERRLGCLGCPLQSDQGVSDYLQYPKLLKRVIFAVCVWWENHPTAQSHKKFPSPYALVGHNLFYRSYKRWYDDTYTLFGVRDWKQYIEDYFKIKL